MNQYRTLAEYINTVLHEEYTSDLCDSDDNFQLNTEIKENMVHTKNLEDQSNSKYFTNE